MAFTKQLQKPEDPDDHAELLLLLVLLQGLDVHRFVVLLGVLSRVSGAIIDREVHQIVVFFFLFLGQRAVIKRVYLRQLHFALLDLVLLAFAKTTASRLRLTLVYCARLLFILPLLHLHDHLKFGVLFNHKLFGQLEVPYEHGPDRHQELVVKGFHAHVVVERGLRVLIAAKHQTNQDQQAFLLSVCILDL